jgi:hypothetical protein
MEVLIVKVTLKVGSVLRVPVLASWTAVSQKPAVLSVSVANGVAVITALAAGTSWIELVLAADLKVSLQVDVMTT